MQRTSLQFLTEYLFAEFIEFRLWFSHQLQIPFKGTPAAYVPLHDNVCYFLIIHLDHTTLLIINSYKHNYKEINKPDADFTQ